MKAGDNASANEFTEFYFCHQVRSGTDTQCPILEPSTINYKMGEAVNALVH